MKKSMKKERRKIEQERKKRQEKNFAQRSSTT